MAITNIFDLPPELITYCFSYLEGTDLARIGQTCSFLKGIASIEKLWQDRCLKEFGLPADTRLKASFKEIYGKVLHKYGKLIGLWRNRTTCYGGLIHIWYTKDGDILVEEFYAQRIVHEHLLKTSVFHITLDEEKNVKLEWLANCTPPQPCTVHHEKVTEKLQEFSVMREEKKTSDKEKETEKLAFLEDCERRGTLRELCMYKWQSYKQNRCKQMFERIDPMRFEPVSKVPIQPGLFKGMYGGHGTEIVHLFYESDGFEGMCGQARKISGDPNVPSGEISVCFYLDKHMLLNKDQQQMNLLHFEEDQETKFPYDSEKPSRQPFAVPPDVLIDDRHAECPKYCLGRFHGKGTVSPMGYRNPTLINIHFVVFDPNLFGVLWMDLQSFSLFSRVEEKFPGLR